MANLPQVDNPPHLERARVADQDQIVGKRRISVCSGADVRHALRSIAMNGYGIAEGPEVPAAAVLNPRFYRNGVSGTTEPVFAADQIARRNTLVASRETQRNAAQSGNCVADSAAE